MSINSRWSVRLVLGLLAVFLSLAQPGLPACWLQAQSCRVHPHFSAEQERMPHSHDYLFDLSITTGAPALPVPVIPVTLLIALLALGLLLPWHSNRTLLAEGWAKRLEPPPPRGALSS
jgi:hypothetical protein